MDKEKSKAIIEAILFAAGREINKKELMSALEVSEDEVISILGEMQEEYKKNNRGIEILKVDDRYQLATKKDYYEYLYPIFDKRSKPNLSQAALETLSIIAYNPNITRAEVENIRGVNSDGTIYKLLEYDLIEFAGKLDAPGRPSTYRTTSNFLKMFGMTNLEELPELPRYKLDENRQIVLEDIENFELNKEVDVEDNKEEKDNIQLQEERDEI